MPKALQLIFTARNSGTFTQVNAITSITNVSFGVPVLYTAAILTA
ncbi:hypothetical protein [uncultured Phascolarctobacterium sp.]|nr:hypothetical protein [uncultured Phascolarctobacterium sp.]